uniref:Uncharacterized protein n=1 Tax=Arundo donax TaxID=35708 RepID=A0A0A8ZRI6_ARUDO
MASQLWLHCIENDDTNWISLEYFAVDLCSVSGLSKCFISSIFL